MDRVYEYEINIKTIYQVWWIRTYLHKRSYNIMYFIMKLLPIIVYLGGGFDSITNILFNTFVFFYFEIVMVVRYFKMKKRLEVIYGSDRTARVEMKQDELVFSTKNANKVLPWDKISYVKETRWFYFVYTEKIVVGTFYKKIMSEEELSGVTSYFKEQADNGRIIQFRK